MRYIPSENKLFLHIPRTGGVAVEKAIREKYEESEMKNLRIRWRSGRHVLKDSIVRGKSGWIEDQGGLFTFTIVRYPLDWYVSNWRFLCTSKRENSWIAKRAWHPQKPMIELWDSDFTRWIDKLLDRQPAYYTRLCEMYCGPEGEEIVDYIGRTETLGQDIHTVLGLNPERKRTNKSVAPTPIVGVDCASKINQHEGVILKRFYSERTMNFRHTGDWKNA